MGTELCLIPYRKQKELRPIHTQQVLYYCGRKKYTVENCLSARTSSAGLPTPDQLAQGPIHQIGKYFDNASREKELAGWSQG
jgi:hypothetical protein